MSSKQRRNIYNPSTERTVLIDGSSGKDAISEYISRGWPSNGPWPSTYGEYVQNKGTVEAKPKPSKNKGCNGKNCRCDGDVDITNMPLCEVRALVKEWQANGHNIVLCRRSCGN